MVPCAYLRVYQPLESFPPEEQAHWERYIVQGGRPRPARPSYREHATVGRLGVMAPVEGDHADVRVVDGVYYVCPWRTRLRILASLLSFREASPLEMSEAFVPDAEARRAAKELARMRRRNPLAISFIMQSPWHVPVRWFVLVDDGERRLVEEDGRHRLSYLTTTRKAIRRAEKAIPVLRKSDLGPVADVIVELRRWLSAFDPRSLLELDYAGLCDLFTWDELDDDHSAGDVQEALKALSSGEFPRSAELYQSVLGRWAEARSHES
ncbi:MAG: hypothetical protein HY511_08765, partial [Actinobacteria bacterium]|nr:hypothetical protein [Actinomycetota bacterium]